MRATKSTLLMALGFALAFLRPTALLAQCDPPAGTDAKYSIEWSPDPPRACPDEETTISVLLDTNQPVQGLGVALKITFHTGQLITVNSIERGIGIPEKWIIGSSSCQETGCWGGVQVGFLASSTPEHPSEVIPEGPGTEIEICRLKITFPPLSPAGWMMIKKGSPTICDSFQYSNHVVVDGCDTGVSFKDLIYYGHCNNNDFYSLSIPMATCWLFRRGDCNHNGLIAGHVGDIAFLLNRLFAGGREPACEASCDANDDGLVNVSDAVYLIDWMFMGGPAPPAPYPDCGPDPTGPALSCLATSCP
jgi:hypothetical protein